MARKSKSKSESETPEWLPVAELIGMAAPYNPRKEMPAEEFKALRRALSELGVLLVFCKGSPEAATEWCGAVDVSFDATGES